MRKYLLIIIVVLFSFGCLRELDEQGFLADEIVYPETVVNIDFYVRLNPQNPMDTILEPRYNTLYIGKQPMLFGSSRPIKFWLSDVTDENGNHTGATEKAMEMVRVTEYYKIKIGEEYVTDTVEAEHTAIFIDEANGRICLSKYHNLPTGIYNISIEAENMAGKREYRDVAQLVMNYVVAPPPRVYRTVQFETRTDVINFVDGVDYNSETDVWDKGLLIKKVGDAPNENVVFYYHVEQDGMVHPIDARSVYPRPDYVYRYRGDFKEYREVSGKMAAVYNVTYPVPRPLTPDGRNTYIRFFTPPFLDPSNPDPEYRMDFEIIIPGKYELHCYLRPFR